MENPLISKEKILALGQLSKKNFINLIKPATMSFMKSLITDFKQNILERVLLLCLMAVFLTACNVQKKEQVSLQRILDRGYVTVGTLFGPTSYYLGAQGPTGYEYELASKYAQYIGVELKVEPSYSIEELFSKLNSGKVDFLAAGLAVTANRKNSYRFAPSYNDITQKLVFKQGNKRPREVSDLIGQLEVTANSSHVENLEQLKLRNAGLTWDENDELDSEELLLKLLNDEIDYTVVDSHTLAVSRRYFPEVSIGFTIKQSEPLAWAVAQSSDHAILASLIEFFGIVHHDGTLLALNDKYYGHVEQFNYVDTRVYLEAIEKTLPTYQPLFEKYSQDLDWRLLAAISYQESHWNPKARSYTGVRGMMMLTLPTAKQMGISSRLDAEQSIQGGAKYFRRMIKRMPERIPEPDRTWFALAAYNVGLGHLNDARRITEKLGGDPDRWVEVKEYLPLLRQKKYYKFTRYGYARGDEAVQYVENIRRYYDTLLWVDENQKANEQQQVAEELLEKGENVPNNENEVLNTEQ